MMTLRARIFAIASVAVLIILAVGIVMIMVSKKKSPAGDGATQPSATTADQTDLPAAITAPPPTQVPNGVSVKPLSSEDVLKNAAKQTARIFIERYGTYSSDNSGENIRACESLVTKELWAEISKRIGVKSANGEFTGATTKVIAVDLTEYNASRAKVEFGVIRTVSKGDNTTEQPAHANTWLVKSGDGWLVEKFEWLP